MASSSAFISVAANRFTLNRAAPSSVSTPKLTGLRCRSCLRVNAIATKWEPAKVVPQADKVLIRLEQLPEKSAGGVLMPKSAVKFERYLMGEKGLMSVSTFLQIVSVGAEAGELEAGKKVLFSDINAYEVDLGSDDKHCFCKASELLAVVE